MTVPLDKTECLYLQISLRIRYSSNINDVCLNVQNKISQALLQMTAIRCKEIDIKIVGFIIKVLPKCQNNGKIKDYYFRIRTAVYAAFTL